MFTALASLLLNRPVRHDVAMTGEITLRGLVLPIGGLKEKTLAAKRAGIKQVIVPKRNEKDLPDIPDEVKQTLKFHFVENIDEVLEVALGARHARAEEWHPRTRTASRTPKRASARPFRRDAQAGRVDGDARASHAAAMRSGNWTLWQNHCSPFRRSRSTPSSSSAPTR